MFNNKYNTNQIKLEIRWGKKQFNLDADLTQDIYILKAQIFSMTNIPIEKQKLIFKGRQLQDNQDLRQLNLIDGSVLMLLGEALQYQQWEQLDNDQQENSGLPSFNKQIFANDMIKPMVESDVQRLIYLFEEERNKGLKHISKIFQDVLLESAILPQNDIIQKMQDLEMIVEELGNPKALMNISGISILLDFALFHPIFAVKKIALSIIGQISQNNQTIQKAAIDGGALTSILNCIQMQQGQKQNLQEQCISALGKLLRGEYLEGKKKFLQLNGISFLVKFLDGQETNSIRQKVLYTLRDFVKWDDKLQHQVKDFLVQSNFIADKIYMLQDTSIKNKEARLAYIGIAHYLQVYYPKSLKGQSNLIEKYYKYQAEISKTNDNEDELQNLKELLGQASQ